MYGFICKFYKGFIILLLALVYIFIYINARIMKFIPNEIRIMFSRFLALLLWFLIIKTFNLKYLVGERYKGYISRPPLLVHSSVKYILCLCFAHSMWRVFISWSYKIEFLGSQQFDQMPCLSFELCIPYGGCFVSWYYKISLLKG